MHSVLHIGLNNKLFTTLAQVINALNSCSCSDDHEISRNLWCIQYSILAYFLKDLNYDQYIVYNIDHKTAYISRFFVIKWDRQNWEGQTAPGQNRLLKCNIWGRAATFFCRFSLSSFTRKKCHMLLSPSIDRNTFLQKVF